MLIFASVLVLSWLFFAVLWYLLPNECVFMDNSFVEALLFSIETQQTIGYGARYITKNCNFGITVLMIQSGFSVILHSLMGGIIFAKLSKPKKRTETLIFSDKAVIAKRDGVYTLMCRIGGFLF